MTPSRNFIVGSRFVGLAWVIGGIVMMAAAGPRVAAGLESRHWPHVTGQIVQSELSAVKNSDGRAAFYKVRIVYAYSPPSQTQYAYAFQGQRISDHGFTDPADDSYTLQQGQGLISKYPIGKPVTVYYSQADLRKSTLRPGFDFGTWGGVLMGFVSLLLGSLLAIYFGVMPTI